MIVVVTNNGCRYINEAAITMLSHIKDEAIVEVCLCVRIALAQICQRAPYTMWSV